MEFVFVVVVVILLWWKVADNFKVSGVCSVIMVAVLLLFFLLLHEGCHSSG